MTKYIKFSELERGMVFECPKNKRPAGTFFLEYIGLRNEDCTDYKGKTHKVYRFSCFGIDFEDYEISLTDSELKSIFRKKDFVLVNFWQSQAV